MKLMLTALLTVAIIVAMFSGTAKAIIWTDPAGNAQGWYNLSNDFNVQPLASVDADDMMFVNKSRTGQQFLGTFEIGGPINNEARGAFAYIWLGGFTPFSTYTLRWTGYTQGILSYQNFTVSVRTSANTWVNFSNVGFDAVSVTANTSTLIKDGGNNGLGIPAYVNESGNIEFKVWANVTGGTSGYFLGLEALNVTNYTNSFNYGVINVFNAWNMSAMNTFSAFVFNMTSNITLASYSNMINLNSNTPTGTNVSITLFKSGYANVTYGPFDINFTRAANETAFMVHENDVVHVNAPTNITYFGNTLGISITTPKYYGNVFTLKYNLTNTGNVTVNTTSSSYSGSLTSTFGVQILRAFAIQTTTLPLLELHEYNSSVNFNVVYSYYNINIKDEMTGGWYNITGKNTTLDVMCANYTNHTTITDSATLNFTIQCISAVVKLSINETSYTQYRTLVPVLGSSNLTFFMINVSTSYPIYRPMFIQDFLGLYNGALVTLKKSIPGIGAQEIISGYMDAENKIMTWLIDGENYQVFVTSGGNTRTTNGLQASASQSQYLIYLSQVSSPVNITAFIGNIFYSFGFSQAGQNAVLTYSDITNQTTYVTMNVYDITNPAHPLLGTQTFTGTLTNPIGSVVITFFPVPLNTSIRVEIRAYSNFYGAIHETRDFYWSSGRIMDLGMPASYDWLYQMGAVALIIIIALLFSAYNAEAGAIVTILFAGMLYIWGWLNDPRYVGAILLLLIVIFASKLRGGERR